MQELREIPRRGTPAFRSWVMRALTIGALPVVTALLGVATIRAFDLAPPERSWTDPASVPAVLLALACLLGFIALLDGRTRAAGLFTVLIALALNPFTATLVHAGLGLT